MENKTRNFVKILNEICEEENIKIESFCYDWVFSLKKGDKYSYILGYQFGLNNASISTICSDKCAASSIMTSLNIPNVEHVFFMSPTNLDYVGVDGNWPALIECLNKYGRLVCKANDGSSGNSVYRVSSQYELENAVYKIFQKSRSMAVSPYYDIAEEFRTIILDGEIKLVYSKSRPYIVGDGHSSIKSLIFNYYAEQGDVNFRLKLSSEDASRILDKGECYELEWKHNLAKGAKAVIVEYGEDLDAIESIVKMVIDKLNIRFASVDIIKSNNEYRVLEINSGVMMEHFSSQDEASYRIAKEIYREAILKTFEQL